MFCILAQSHLQDGGIGGSIETVATGLVKPVATPALDAGTEVALLFACVPTQRR